MTKSKSHQERAVFRSGRTPEFYRKFITSFRSSGMTLSDYCRMLTTVCKSLFRLYAVSSAFWIIRGPSQRTQRNLGYGSGQGRGHGSCKFLL
jgi:hypothetical protein